MRKIHAAFYLRYISRPDKLIELLFYILPMNQQYLKLTRIILLLVFFFFRTYEYSMLYDLFHFYVYVL